MEANTHSLLPENGENLDALSGQEQKEIYFLNEDTNLDTNPNEVIFNYTPSVQEADFFEEFKEIDQIDLLAEDGEVKHLLGRFEPKSLGKLQRIGISVSELIYNGTLLSLSSLIPTKIQIQPANLSQPLLLLIQPQLTEDNSIHLTILPYAKYIPPIPLTINQQEAVNQATPFFMLKRVVEGVLSPVFEHKQNELWDTLTLSVSIQKKLFKELMEVIKHEPLNLQKWIKDQFWTPEQSEKAIKIIDHIFPLQLGLFTGLHLLFYPFEGLHRFPHLQQLIQAKHHEL
jgi:hypothetical protein